MFSKEDHDRAVGNADWEINWNSVPSHLIDELGQERVMGIMIGLQIAKDRLDEMFEERERECDEICEELAADLR